MARLRALGLVLGTGLALCMTAAPAAASTTAGDVEPAAATGASWQMDEPSGATVMQDSSGNGLDGKVNQAGLDTGATFDGETGYRWAFKAPNSPPATPERIVTVSDNSALDPGTSTWTVTIKYRTSHGFGNIIQKGQSASKGGQFKIQNPQGRPSCLFKGSGGRQTARSPKALDDNQWHVLKCVRTTSSVTMYVDGAQVSKKNGPTGTIDNSIPLTIGGKLNCDQVKVTCDYFTGDIGYVTVSKG